MIYVRILCTFHLSQHLLKLQCLENLLPDPTWKHPLSQPVASPDCLRFRVLHGVGVGHLAMSRPFSFLWFCKLLPPSHSVVTRTHQPPPATAQDAPRPARRLLKPLAPNSVFPHPLALALTPSLTFPHSLLTSFLPFLLQSEGTEAPRE